MLIQFVVGLAEVVCMWCSGSVLHVSDTNMNKSYDIKHDLFAVTEMVVGDLFMSCFVSLLSLSSPVCRHFLLCSWF